MAIDKKNLFPVSTSVLDFLLLQIALFHKPLKVYLTFEFIISFFYGGGGEYCVFYVASSLKINFTKYRLMWYCSFVLFGYCISNSWSNHFPLFHCVAYFI